MLELMGAALLAVAAVLCGFYTADIVKARCDILEECIILIRSVASQINYADEPVKKILFNTVKGYDYKFLTFLKVVAETEFSDGFDKLWCDCIETGCTGVYFEKQTVEMLKAFGQKLGKTDSSGQKELCIYYERKFEQLINMTKEKRSEKMKLCRIVGLAVGTIIFVFAV